MHPNLTSQRTITLVAASAIDAEQLVALRIDAMRESLERIGRFDPDRARQRFLDSFAPQWTRHIELNSTRVGFVVVKPDGDGLLLDHLYVQNGLQDQGIGSTVLLQVFAEADALALAIRVGALLGSDSNQFYRRHGFELIERGEFDNYYVRPSPRRCEPID